MQYVLLVYHLEGITYFGPFEDKLDAADWWADVREQFPHNAEMEFKVERLRIPFARKR